MKRSLLASFLRSARRISEFGLVGILALLPVAAQVSRLKQPGVTVGAQELHGHLTPAMRKAPLVERLPVSTKLHLAIGLPLRKQSQLNATLSDIYNPGSPNFHHYLTAKQFAETYGPSNVDYQAVVDFARAKGLAVNKTFANRVLLEVSGARDIVEKAFYVTMNNYKRPDGTIFYAPDREPSLDLSVAVLHISGLDNYTVPQPVARTTPPDLPFAGVLAFGQTGGGSCLVATGSGPCGLFSPSDLRAAYAPGLTLNGAGQCVALLEFDTGFSPGDITGYENEFGLPKPNVPVQTILEDGDNGSPTGDNAQVEVTLDIEMAMAMAPGLNQIQVIIGHNTDSILGAMAALGGLCNQLSASWTFPVDGLSTQLFAEMAAHGQSFFVSSGDDGAYQAPGQTAGDPGGDRDEPNVTIVGGTVLALNNPGTSPVYSGESGWVDSGGGVLSNDLIAPYQGSFINGSNRGSIVYRNAPDVSIVADFVSLFVFNTSGALGVGTSISTPLWAAYIALANQQASSNGRPPVGFVNPGLYFLASCPTCWWTEGSNSIITSAYDSLFHDVQSGNNDDGNTFGYNAVPGFDLVTGLGSPQPQLILDLTQTCPSGTTLPTVNISFDPVSVAQGKSATLSWSSQNASSCSITAPSGNAIAFTTSGHKTVSAPSSGPVPSEYPYSIVCSGSCHDVTAGAFLKVPTPPGTCPTGSTSSCPSGETCENPGYYPTCSCLSCRKNGQGEPE